MFLSNTRKVVSVFGKTKQICKIRHLSIKSAVYGVGQAFRETGAALDSLGLRSIDKVSVRSE